MIVSYAILKEAASIANHDSGLLADEPYRMVLQVCDEILAGRHHDMFPFHVWMTGSGTRSNMNVNEVISNRCCLKAAALKLGFVTADEFDRIVDPAKMVRPYVADTSHGG